MLSAGRVRKSPAPGPLLRHLTFVYVEPARPWRRQSLPGRERPASAGSHRSMPMPWRVEVLPARPRNPCQPARRPLPAAERACPCPAPRQVAPHRPPSPTTPMSSILSPRMLQIACRLFLALLAWHANRRATLLTARHLGIILLFSRANVTPLLSCVVEQRTPRDCRSFSRVLPHHCHRCLHVPRRCQRAVLGRHGLPFLDARRGNPARPRRRSPLVWHGQSAEQPGSAKL